MNPRTRFFLALAAFLAWIGYLGYLVAITRDPIILSRPQFLPANVYVLAQLTGAENPDKTVSFTEVPWAADGMGPAMVGNKVEVQPLGILGGKHGWRGPGIYILPLMRSVEGSYHLAPTPPSPGYSPPLFERYRIYPATPAARQQLEEILAKKQ